MAQRHRSKAGFPYGLVTWWLGFLSSFAFFAFSRFMPRKPFVRSLSLFFQMAVRTCSCPFSRLEFASGVPMGGF
jgi:hypothetical protein